MRNYFTLLSLGLHTHTHTHNVMCDFGIWDLAMCVNLVQLCGDRWVSEGGYGCMYVVFQKYMIPLQKHTFIAQKQWNGFVLMWVPECCLIKLKETYQKTAVASLPAWDTLSSCYEFAQIAVWCDFVGVQVLSCREKNLVGECFCADDSEARDVWPCVLWWR
jgi:hypothetical protein